MSKLVKLNFAAGFHRESTQYAEEGKWYDGDRVRFRDGKPEVLRGFEKRVDTVLTPCGHTFCLECLGNTSECYSCRGKIDSKHKIYFG